MKQKIESHLVIPKSALPSNKQKINGFLETYFSGFDIDLQEEMDSFTLTLHKSDFAYCEDLTEGLSTLGVIEDTAGDYCEIVGNSCVCISENWLPYALRFMSSDEMFAKRTAIIHIDDHTDLMTPFIAMEAGAYKNLLTNEISESLSVAFLKNAVDSGAITIGSTLTTIVYLFKCCNIYHLKRNVRNCRSGIVKRTFPDDIICGQERIGIEFTKEYSDCSYFRSSNIEDIKNQLQGEEQCILHIDMDYFNNRYNGSTSWRQDPQGKDYPFDEQILRMDEIFQAVTLINTTTSIKYILLGLSSSFYPAEYWGRGLKYMENGLRAAGISCNLT